MKPTPPGADAVALRHAHVVEERLGGSELRMPTCPGAAFSSHAVVATVDVRLVVEVLAGASEVATASWVIHVLLPLMM